VLDKSVEAIVILPVPSNAWPAIVLALAKAVAVSAFPVISPVTFPCKFATSVPVVIVKSPVVEPVNDPVPTINLSALSSKPIKALFELPLSIIIPESPDGVPDVPVANSISLSLIVELVVSTLVVEPETVKLPEITASPDKFNEPAVIAPALEISIASFKTKFVLSVVLICLSAIFTVPAVTLVKPAKVVELAPKLIDVEPTVTAEFESDELPIFDNVFDDPLIVLFVSVFEVPENNVSN